MENIFALVVLAGLLIYNEILHQRERSQLLDRIMSKNFQEFATWKNEELRVNIDEQKNRDEYVPV